METEKTCTRFRCIFPEEKPEKHQTATNSKSKNLILFLPETGNRKPRAKTHRNRNRHQTRTTDLKMAETAKPKIFLELKEICKENSVTINLNSNVEEMNSKEQRSITFHASRCDGYQEL